MESLTSKVTSIEITSEKNKEEIGSIKEELLATQMELQDVKQDVSSIKTKTPQNSIQESNQIYTLLVNQAKVVRDAQIKIKS